jgi:hypothetical protein
MQKSWLHHFQSRKYLTASFPKNKISFTGNSPKLGFIFDFYFFKVQYFVSKIEPDYEKFSGLSIIFWDREFEENQTKKVFNWHRISFIFDAGRPAIARINLQEKTLENYFKSWSETTKRYRNIFLAKLESEIFVPERTDFETFLEVYKKSSVSFFLKPFFIKQLNSFYRVYKSDMSFSFIKDSCTKEIISGLATIYDSETDQSFYLVIFNNKTEKEYKTVGVGAVCLWIEDCIKAKIAFANFGVVWTSGFPKSWKGYSNFKRKFSPEIAEYRQTYFKIVWKK